MPNPDPEPGDVIEYLPCGGGPWTPYVDGTLRVRLSDVRTYRVTGWSGHFDRPWRIYVADRDDYDTEVFFPTREAAAGVLDELRRAPITRETLSTLGFSS